MTYKKEERGLTSDKETFSEQCTTLSSRNHVLKIPDFTDVCITVCMAYILPVVHKGL